MAARLDYAEQLKENPVFKEVVARMYAAVDAKELKTDPTDKDLCQALIITRQQITQIMYNIDAIIRNEQTEIELSKKPEPKEAVFKR